MNLRSNKVFKYILKYGYLCLGLFIFAIAFNLFMLPNNFVVGGVSGIAIILNNFFGWDSSLCVSVLSIILLILGFIFCNKDRISSSVASTFILPIFMKLTSNITEVLVLDISLLLSSLYCAILVGIALGLIYKVGFSTGGTDILYWILEKYIKKSTGQLMMFVEGIIVIIGAFVFGFERLMYSLIILFLMSRISDKFVIGISDYKLVCIIPNKVDEVMECINSLSYVKSFKLVTTNNKDVLYCILLSKDYRVLYSSIKEIDKDVFMSVNNTYETIGGY